MRNVSAKVNGKKLVIEVDLNEKGELSSSGKSFTLGTTNGFANVDGHEGVQLSLNVIRKNPEYSKKK